jgi:hypothetical protein
LTTEADGIVGNEVVGPADSTLTLSGSGTAGDPYKLALNLANPNTWTGLQSFNPTGSNAPFKVDPSKTDVVTFLNADMLDGKHATDFALSNHTHDLAGSTITGVLPVSKGGTGLSSPGASGNLLRSNGTAWESWTPNFLTSEVDGIVGNEVIDAANSTLVRSGSGTANDPYKLALNLANSNTWTGLQRFNPSSGSVPFLVDSSKTGVVTNLNADMLDGLHSTSFALAGTVWELKGNANTDPNSHFIGTKDQRPVVFRSNNFKVLSLEWKQGTSDTGEVVSANVIGVPDINSAHASAIGVVIGGGGEIPQTGPGTGGPNKVSQSFAAIVGGKDNVIGSDIFTDTTFGSFIGGGESNRIVDSNTGYTPSFATIVGGLSNQVQGDYGFIGGGLNNTVGGKASAICGGAQNEATSNYSFVGGGYHNQALGVSSVVAGGDTNIATGSYSAVLGGIGNTALGIASFAGGTNAIARYDGCFVWRGYEGGQVTSPLECDREDQFLVRARGGVKLCVDVGKCCTLQLVGGVPQWDCVLFPSDRNSKLNATDVDPLLILERVASLEVSTWSYKDVPAVKHIGPMAQDFYDLFGFGASRETISPQDLIGVTLAAVQGLNIKVDSEVEALKRQVEEQNREIEQLRAEIAQLKAMLGFQKAR